jgi:hypothetical protein
MVVLVPLWLWSHESSTRAEEPGTHPDQEQSRGDRLGLADLAGYRAALAGKPVADDATAADPPIPVRFRDLWDHPGAFQGRRVTVQGRVERVFRQGPAGTFPPLVEAWLFSTAGDPFCVVFPRSGATIEGGREPGIADRAAGDHGQETRAAAPGVLDAGRRVRFTGTFLRMIRYKGGDGPRLVPMIVGDRPPQAAPVETDGDRSGSAASGEPRGGPSTRGPDIAGSVWLPAGWVLGLALALLAAGMIARQHLREPRRPDRSVRRTRSLEETEADLPLRFVDSPDESPPRT